MTNIDFIPVLVYLAIFLLILLLSELSYKWFVRDSELTRKISHTVTGLVSLGIPRYFDGYSEVLILAVFSFLLLFISKKAGAFPSIHKLDRKSSGASLLPVAIFLCYTLSELLQMEVYYFIPVLILSISDPAAGILGGRFSSVHWRKIGATAATKTYLGSLIFFISAYLIVLFTIPVFYSLSVVTLLLVSLAIAIVSTLVELTSGKGFDNLTVPVSVIAFLFIMESWII